MPAFPSYAEIFMNTSERPGSVVARSEMERGFPRQRRVSADARVQMPVEVLFRTPEQAAEFETWFYGDVAGGALSFEFTHPRTRQVLDATIVDGDIGELVPLSANYGLSKRGLTIEYIRPGFITLAPGQYPGLDASRILSTQRNSVGTYLDGAGVLRTAAANVPRYQGGVLLVEPAGTNLLGSSDLAAPFGVFGVGSASTVSVMNPRGATGNCTRISSGVGTTTIRYGSPGGGNPASAYAGGLWLRLVGGSANVLLDVNDGAAVPAAVTGTWQRFGAARPPAADAYLFLDVTLDALSVGVQLDMFGVQLEQGTALSSYIPTPSGLTATRQADIITVAA